MKSFKNALTKLEKRAFEIQMEFFKIPPEERGRKFYSMELVGEMGEVLNACKKFLRTKLEHRRENHAKVEIPEETADTLVGLMLVKLAAKDNRPAEPFMPESVPENNVAWLHLCLSKLAAQTSALYEEEARRAEVPAPYNDSFDIKLYKEIVETLLKVTAYFKFDLEEAAHEKLTAIIEKVEAGYYD